MMECILNFIGKFFRKKNIAKETSLATPLKRCLTTTDLTFYAVSHMAGAGIYVITGRLIRDISGPATGLSYLIAAASALFTGVCYAEFATLIPKAGSCYTYTYIVLGELPAYIIGWTMLSDILIGMATVAKSFSGTIDLLCGGAISNWTLSNVGRLSENSTLLDESLDIVACGFLLLLTMVVLAGAKISLSLNSVLTTAQVMCLTSVAVACFVWGDIKNWTDNGGFVPYGFTGVISGSGIAVFAFSGFEAVAIASEEAKNPRRSIPIALFLSLGIITVLYVLACLGLSYIIPRNEINYASPFVAAFMSHNIDSFKWIAAIGTLLATGATKIASMYVIPRMFYRMASDGLIFKWIGYVNKCSQVPIFGLFIGGIISATIALFLDIRVLADFTTLGILFAYCTIGLNVIVLRYLHLLNDIRKVENNTDLARESLIITNESLLNIRPWFKLLPLKSKFWRLRCVFRGILVSLLIIIISISTFVDYMIVQNSTGVWSIFGILVFLFIVTFGLLCIYQPNRIDESFNTPLMPLAPVLTILINMVLILRLPPMTWMRFVIWSTIGLVIYLCYGVHHSTVYQDDNYEPLKTIDECNGEEEIEIELND